MTPVIRDISCRATMYRLAELPIAHVAIVIDWHLRLYKDDLTGITDHIIAARPDLADHVRTLMAFHLVGGVAF